MNAPKIFARLTKIDEEKRLVFGRIAQEVVDKSDEILDYAKSKPFFKAWSDEVSSDTDGKSLGNVRAMHGKVAAGVLKSIDFDDAGKFIDVGAHIVDDQEWKKCLTGTYSGFSIGGSYVGDKTVEKFDGRDVKRYTAKPNEVSLVDRPCIPTAKFFEVQKADGSLQKVDFKEPAAEELIEKADDATVEGTPEQVDELTKLMAEHKVNMGIVVDLVKAFTKKPDPKDDKDPDGDGDDDTSKSGDTDKDAVGAADDTSKDPTNLPDDPDDKDKKDKKENQPADKAETEGDLQKAGARHSKDDLAKVQAMHDHAVALGADCAGAAKAETVDDLLKADFKDTLQKMVSEATEPLNKALQEANAKIEKLEAQPLPPTIRLRAVGKTEDTGDDGLKKAQQAQPVVDDHGEQHPVAGLIKSLHANGGAPLMKG